MSPDYHAHRLKENGGWALATDGIQWIIMHHHGPNSAWEGKIFVSTDRIVLECQMQEVGIPKPVREDLLWGLPETFGEWISDDQRAKYRDTQRKRRKSQAHQAAIDLGFVKPVKSGRSHRKPRREQSTAPRGRRR